MSRISFNTVSWHWADACVSKRKKEASESVLLYLWIGKAMFFLDSRSQSTITTETKLIQLHEILPAGSL